MNADPGRAADGERAADRRRADGALHDRGGEVARPDLARRRVEPAELGLGQTDDELAVEHADRRRHRAALAHRALGREPDLDALAGRKAVRDERRLERDDAAARRRVRRATSSPNADHGIAPSCAQQRAAASSPSSGAADEEARRERVAGARRVDDRRPHGRVVDAVDATARRAPRFITQRVVDRRRRPRARARSRRARSGASCAQPLAERVVDERPRRDVERDARAARARELAAAATAASASGARSSE